MPEPTARVSCPACFGDGTIDLRDDNALLAEHLTDAQLRRIRQTAAWRQPVRPCDECDGLGEVSAVRAETLRREAHTAVQKALNALNPQEGPMETIYDSKGVLITIGARVVDPATGKPEGTVTNLIDLDGDAHDDGTPFAVGPFVVVKYDDGTEERWTASWNATGPWDDHRTDYSCDDVTVTT